MKPATFTHPIMTAYYNEIDPYAAQWLRNLIEAGHIAYGVVDERSIEDVRPDEIANYTQCHFFAGIGVWSLALRNAGWDDDRPVWTGSCPCQPFSAAGKGLGFADERHLWPAFHWLIEQCCPTVLFGEQVASKIVDDWLDVVSADLEGLGFAVGAAAFPAAGVGAPHIRDRTYFMAYADDARSQGRQRVRERAAECIARSSGLAGIVADADNRSEHALLRRSQNDSTQDIWRGTVGGPLRRLAIRDDGEFGRIRKSDTLADTVDRQLPETGWRPVGRIGPAGSVQEHSEPGPTNGFWRAADWLLCRDQKWRPVEPGAFPLADGAPSRVGRLRAYGNAIVAPQATEFIRIAMECLPCEV